MQLHLTEPRGATWKKAAAATVDGMAYFAHTGPARAVCRQCAHWGTRRRRDEHGLLQPARCREYVRIRKGQGLEIARDGVPPETPACKYFVNHRRPPVLQRSRGQHEHAAEED